MKDASFKTREKYILLRGYAQYLLHGNFIA